jgi:hypothetical protein
MSKTLCKLAKSPKASDREGLDGDLVHDGRLVCRKCGRMANKKKRLCKPQKKV